MAFLARGLRLPIARSVRQLTFSTPLASAVKPVTRDELMVQWTEYFDSDECDYFYFRKGASQLLADDLIPDPKVYQVMLK